MSAVLILIYICGILLAICILAMIVAGIKGAFTQGVEIQKVGTVVVAAIAFVVSYAVVGGLMKAAILAMIVMLVLALVALVLTGLRGAIKL